VRGYASDVTRTYAVGGVFAPEQALVYETVRRAGAAAIAACQPNVEWREVHRAAALVVADGLVELGVLRGHRESLVESGAVSLFFPHGVGHMVGLGVRDAGTASDEIREPAPGLPRLRVDIPLAPRQAWTVEPGVYVVPALLRSAHGRDDVVWDRVDQLRGFGGVRLLGECPDRRRRLRGADRSHSARIRVTAGTRRRSSAVATWEARVREP
jgi:Xaa-Pro aminopeptidase